MTMNLAFLEEMYGRWIDDPTSVDAEWRKYFADFDGEGDPEARRKSVSGPSLVAPTLFDPARTVPHGGADGSGDGADVLALLGRVRMFAQVPDAEIARVASIAKEVRVREGHVLFSEGDVGPDMFLILGGTVLIQKDGRVIAELGVGEVVGEMAILDGLPRSADAVAHKNVRLLRVGGEDLLALLERRPVLARGIIRMLSGRLRDTSAKQDRVDQLIRAYRVRGHLSADLNPLGTPDSLHRELDPAHYDLTEADMGQTFSSRTIPGTTYLALGDILAHLRKTYCGSIGAQYMHIDDLDVKDWIQEQLEGPGHEVKLSRDEQLRILTKLTDAEMFEQFIHRKFLGAKRFSLEGAESLIPLMDLAIEEAGRHDIDEMVIGMAHRGRLNVLANVLEKSPRQIFSEFDDADADVIESMRGGGDVKYHLGYSSDRKTDCDKTVHLSLTFNPSHLECVGPVVQGRTRAKQDRNGDPDRSRRIGVVIHGDAAFAGQGVVQEMLNMSELPGFTTGGTLHIIVNNQIGFTTPPERSRSTQYATDVARMLQIPIFHVNGEHPEPVARVIKLAMDFRQKFKKDVVIDMYCYRRYGHNETDEPAFTQPVLYSRIRKRKSVREGYLDSLLALGDMSRADADAISVARRQRLEDELAVARSDGYSAAASESGAGVWSVYSGANEPAELDVDTSVDPALLTELLVGQTEVPDYFRPHPKIKKLLATRAAMARGERPLDWAAAELGAYASLLAEGASVRLIGQDAGRGTFSHRHAVLYDVENGEWHLPLQHLSPDYAKFEVWDSPLTETAVMGFEYGYSLDRPDGLTLWEAQFGDFVNMAQVIIDQFISSGEDKWARMSGLVMLLPHGYEGQGPEHSSARLERFLALAAEDNLRICNLTTPGQLFHALRRQIHQRSRKPLIVMSPKSLLRHPEVVASVESVATGRFEPVISDTEPLDKSKVKKVLLTSGKLYYELSQDRLTRGIKDVAIVRLEQYYPLRQDWLTRALDGYPEGTPVVWAQEEPFNMGAWPYLRLHIGDRLLDRYPFSAVTRPESASPATGSAAAHKLEQAELIADALDAQNRGRN